MRAPRCVVLVRGAPQGWAAFSDPACNPVNTDAGAWHLGALVGAGVMALALLLITVSVCCIGAGAAKSMQPMPMAGDAGGGSILCGATTALVNSCAMALAGVFLEAWVRCTPFLSARHHARQRQRMQPAASPVRRPQAFHRARNRHASNRAIPLRVGCRAAVRCWLPAHGPCVLQGIYGCVLFFSDKKIDAACHPDVGKVMSIGIFAFPLVFGCGGMCVMCCCMAGSISTGIKYSQM